MKTNSTINEMARLAAQMDTAAIAQQITAEEQLYEQLEHETQLGFLHSRADEKTTVELRDMVVERLFALREELKRRNSAKPPARPHNCS